MVRYQTFKLQKLESTNPIEAHQANKQTHLSFMMHWRFDKKLTVSVIVDDICQNMHFMVEVLVNPVFQWQMMPMRRFQHLNKIFLWTCQLFLNNVCYVVWLFWLEEDRGRRRDDIARIRTDIIHTSTKI